MGRGCLSQEKRVPDGIGRERVLLVGVVTPNDREGSTIDELDSLVQTAGAEVVGRVIQKMTKSHPATYVGKGKLQEVKELAGELGANLIAVDHDLSPAQGRKLEEALEIRVIDRSEVILDIFARNARTRQAQLQVMLAQLQYTRPRLKRMWTHLSRTGGGVGTRGPGEQQLEIDRRVIERRINDFKEELEGIRDRKEREVEARTGRFHTVSIVGYTNAGKSTLANRLTGSDLYVADQLFATLDTRTRSWKIAGSREVLLSDTVGFIRRLPHHLIESFHATLMEASHADLLLHVVDAAHPEADLQIRAVDRVLGSLGLGDKPTLLVLNKVDGVADRLDLAALRGTRWSIDVSARTGEGIEALGLAVKGYFDEKRPLVRVTLSVTNGSLLHTLHQRGSVERQTYEDTKVLLEMYLDPDALGSLRAQPEVEVEVL